MAKRKNYSPDFKAKIVLAALSNEKTVAALSTEHGIHQNLINKWKAQLKESAAGIFACSMKTEDAKRKNELHDLHEKIGQLIVERDFFSKSLGEEVSVSRRKSMVMTDHEKLSITRQCALLHLSRSSLYYKKTGESAYNVALMREIDKAYLQWPFFGVRQMRRYLVRLGYPVGDKRVRRLMRLMGIMAIYHKPRTSIPDPANRR